MKLQEKFAPAKRAIDFIATHDDEPLKARQELLQKLKIHIDAELKKASEREQAKAKQQAEEKSIKKDKE